MRRHIRGQVRLKYLNASGKWPSGNDRVYYRRRGYKSIPLPDLPMCHPDFLRAYTDAASSTPAPKTRARSGTIGAAVEVYLASDSYLMLAASSRQVWRRIAEKIKQDYGSATLATLQPKHIRMDLAQFAAHPANNRLKIWRAMCRHWVEVGLIDTNPARDVTKRKTPAAEGATAWTRKDFTAFRKRWPIGSPERMAFELMYRTCCAIGDAVRLGPNMARNGWITYTRKKTGTEATAPFVTPGPDWFEATDDLAKCIEAAPRALTYLCKTNGAPRSAKGAASWFSRACTSAGLPDLSAHGIRKGRAAIFKENGASQEQRMAILGHETKEEALHYSKSADLQKIISGTESANSPETATQLSPQDIEKSRYKN